MYTQIILLEMNYFLEETVILAIIYINTNYLVLAAIVEKLMHTKDIFIIMEFKATIQFVHLHHCHKM